MGKSYEELMQSTPHPRLTREQERKLIATIVSTKRYDSEGNLTNIETRIERYDDKSLPK